MRALLQRVQRAQVRIDGEIVGQIGQGLLVLLGIGHQDSEKEADQLLEKIVNLRIFADEHGKMNRSVQDIAGSILLVSQFTLYANTKKGRRPSYIEAAGPDHAIPLYEYAKAAIAQRGIPVETGRFGADMQVELVNDGPVTIWLDTAEL